MRRIGPPWSQLRRRSFMAPPFSVGRITFQTLKLYCPPKFPLSTTTHRKSLTFVPVGPVMRRSPSPSKNRRGVVILQEVGGIEAQRGGPCEAGGIGKRARGVARRPASAVCSVGVRRKRGDSCRSIDRAGKRQRIFLVRSTLTVAANSDSQLAARQEDSAASGAKRLEPPCAPCAAPISQASPSSASPSTTTS